MRVVEHVVQWAGDGGVVAHAATEEVCHAEEGAELSDGGGLRPIEDGGDLGGVGGDAGSGDHMADKVDLGDGEVAFGSVGIEIVGSEGGEGGAEMDLVLLHVMGEHQDVIEIDDDKGVEVGAEDVVHEALESGGCICEAEGHDGILEMAIAGAEGGLGDVVGVYADLVVAMAQVDLGEDCGAMEAIEELVDTGEGVAVLDRDVVETTVIDA